MSTLFTQLFNHKKPVIGMIHLLPTLNFKDYANIDDILQAARVDAEALIMGGVDGIMIENNYDIPHLEFVDAGTISILSIICQEIRKKTNLPLGICALWNDYKTSLSIAKICKLQFVRIPIFVNSVDTDYGKIFASPEKVIDFRKYIQGENIAILNDVHVKHARIISSLSIAQSVQFSELYRSDGVIITGKWTGDSPLLTDLQIARSSCGLPILVGSGSTMENSEILLNNSDGLIIGTYFKSGKMLDKEQEVNIKTMDQRINLQKVMSFMTKVKSVR